MSKITSPRLEILFIYMSRSDFWKSKTKINIINIASIYEKGIDFANGRGLFLLSLHDAIKTFFLIFISFSLYDGQFFFLLLCNSFHLRLSSLRFKYTLFQIWLLNIKCNSIFFLATGVICNRWQWCKEKTLINKNTSLK